MANKPICTNARISNPRKSLELFQELDLERFHDLGLASRVVFYLGRGLVESNGITRKYKGEIFVSPKGNSFSDNYNSNEILLPKSSDFKWSAQNESREGMVYFENELNGPGEIEFDIHAKTISGYCGLDALRKTVIPEMFRRGYEGGNAEHTSIFWLYLCKNVNSTEVILNTSSHGLSVKSKEVDGIKVFTDADLKKFSL